MESKLERKRRFARQRIKKYRERLKQGHIPKTVVKKKRSKSRRDFSTEDWDDMV